MPLPVLADFPDTPPCSCSGCKRLCRRPCWPTPGEAEALLDAGYADRLMLDAWMGDPSSLTATTYLVCPANPGYEESLASGLGDDDDGGGFFSSFAGLSPLSSGCVLQGKDGLCALHEPGLKPSEGRKAGHSSAGGNLHLAIAATWATDRGKAVVARFCAAVGLEVPYA